MAVTMVDHVDLSDEVCEAFLEIFDADPGVNHVQTLRQLGVPGTAGQIREAVNRQLRPFMGAIRQDVVRRELYRRGIDGWDEPVFHQGKQVAEVRKFSDPCLIFLGKCTLPEARNQLDVNVGGYGGGPVRVEVEDRSASLEAIARVLEAVGALPTLSSGAARGELPSA